MKDVERTVLEIIDAGHLNINVLRKFFLHSKGIIDSENAFKLINAILSAITHEIELLPEKEISEDARVKRHKPSEKKDTDSHGKDILIFCNLYSLLKLSIILYVYYNLLLEMSNHLQTNNGLNKLSTIQILVDVSALLYAVNNEEFFTDKFKSEMKELNPKIAQKMRHILDKFEVRLKII